MSDSTPGDSGTPGPELSIVLATLNERANLPDVLTRIFAQKLPSYEILIVDDGSTDGTREYLQELAMSDRRVRPLFHDGKQTTLRAQCQGIDASLGPRVVIMDADRQHPPESLPALVQALDRGASLVVASRYAIGGSPGKRTLARVLISRGAEWLAKLFLREARRVTDPVSGYFAFERAIWIPLEPKYRGYKLLLFVLAMATGRPVAEVGFRFVGRGEGQSKVTANASFVRLFAVEVRLARRLAAQVRARRLRLL